MPKVVGFSDVPMEEEKKATVVTQHIIAQNIGVLGSSTDSSRVAIEQSSHGDHIIDQRRLGNLVAQMRQAAPLLPDELRVSVVSKIGKLDSATSEGEKRSILSGLKATLQGASDNLIATGIIELISSIF